MKKRSSTRRRPRFRRQTRPGAAPGIVKTHPDSAPPRIYVMGFGRDHFEEREIPDVTELTGWIGKHRVIWVNVEGLGDATTIRKLGDHFGLHALALEDVVNAHQRVKLEPYGEHLFIVLRMMRGSQQLETEQLSLFLGPNYVLTFQDLPGDCLAPVRERIRHNSGRTRREAADYLTYTIMDAVIDAYFPVVESLADDLDALEDEIDDNPAPELNARIHRARSNLLFLRRAIRPHRDALNELIRDEHPLVREETRIYLRDCYDHASQLIDLLEVYREMTVSLRDLYLSTISNRTNEIMKVLTIIATIFIPLGFIAGVYGMNFDTRLPGNMPELHWPYGYVMVLGLMLTVAGVLLAFFRRKGWIGAAWRAPSDSL